MNSVDRISAASTEDSLPYYSPTFKRRTAACYLLNYHESSPKKDKKWSFGNLFRRKKKDNNSESSSDENNQKKRFSKKKKKNDKNKTSKPVGTFDHIVIPSNRKLTTNGYVDDSAILSDPAFLTVNYGKPKISTPGSDGSSRLQSSQQSLESYDLSKQSRRGRTKARAELRRGYIKDGSSSDDESQRSISLKSDGVTNRKSRSARTERYIRRLSKDEEKILNKEAQLIRAYKSDVENYDKRLLRSCDLSTIPPNEHYKSKLNAKEDNLKVPVEQYRSYSCEADIHKSPSPETVNTVIHAQLPLRKPQRKSNLSLTELRPEKQPPPPPPRDPRRVLSKYENSRPLSFNFDNEPPPIILPSRENLSKSQSLNWHPGFRTNSEDQLCNLSPRPSSVTPDANRTRLLRKQERIDPDHFIEPNRFRYYMDKKPRSRKPICIQSNDALQDKEENAWHQKETKSPLMFTAQTHVRTNVFLPAFSSPKPEDTVPPKESTDEIKRKSSNLEEALDELEAIYKSLHLGDEDLLERAEQREKSIAIEKFAKSKSESFPDFVYESCSPKSNRYSRNNRKNDDMALRKLQKERHVADQTTGSYLLVTPSFVSVKESAPKTKNEPDVTYDDVVFRNIKQARMLKVPDPQPPFGIPLGPITLAANSDYLHAIPDNQPKSCKTPDIVKDDLAYRNLRKDRTKEAALPPLNSEDFINNNYSNDSNTKKKRAVRSLSANIYNLMHNDSSQFKKKENLNDIADAMEIARQILKQKEEKLNNANRAFLSDTDTRLNRYEFKAKEDRLNFLNEMKSQIVSEVAPVKNSLDDLINALAAEARETTERLTSELNQTKPIESDELNKALDESKKELPKAKSRLRSKTVGWNSSLDVPNNESKRDRSKSPLNRLRAKFEQPIGDINRSISNESKDFDKNGSSFVKLLDQSKFQKQSNESKSSLTKTKLDRYGLECDKQKSDLGVTLDRPVMEHSSKIQMEREERNKRKLNFEWCKTKNDLDRCKLDVDKTKTRANKQLDEPRGDVNEAERIIHQQIEFDRSKSERAQLDKRKAVVCSNKPRRLNLNEIKAQSAKLKSEFDEWDRKRSVLDKSKLNWSQLEACNSESYDLDRQIDLDNEWCQGLDLDLSKDCYFDIDQSKDELNESQFDALNAEWCAEITNLNLPSIEKSDLDRSKGQIERFTEEVDEEKEINGETASGNLLQQLEEPKETIANVVITSTPIEEFSRQSNDSDHDYENCGSEAEIERNLPFIDDDLSVTPICKSPFEEHKDELIAGFQQLNKMSGSSDEGERECLMFDNERSHVDSMCANYLSETDIYVNESSSSSPSSSSSSYTYVTNCDIYVNDGNEDDDTLKSPKLVYDQNRKLIEVDSSKNLNSRQQSSRSNVNDSLKPKKINDENNKDDVDNDRRWHTIDSTLNWARNPLALALACTYGLACANQLVSLDLVTILSILFFIMSFVAAILF